MTKKYDFNSSCYDDIIRLPHHISETHPQMTIRNRAAQFSPFAALSGYEDALEETERLTHRRAALAEDAKAALDEKLQRIQKEITACPKVTVTYFVPDERKAGGAYKSVLGKIKKIDRYEKLLVMDNGTKIPMEEITEIEGTIFGT
ncbi:MAG: YolD-like family protein [Lachnospiraceae bacterium]|nr:YolD-like family protein [Lachnospiraceae bacterium]MDE6185466.1 YolD-like family protein [Lachnospiraceae bacterium]